MGRTVATGTLAPLFAIRRDGAGAVEDTDGQVTADGRVWGTYLHGCFDPPEVRGTLLAWLSGLSLHREAPPPRDYRVLRETAYGSLAEALRPALNLPAVRTLIGL